MNKFYIALPLLTLAPDVFARGGCFGGPPCGGGGGGFLIVGALLLLAGASGLLSTLKSNKQQKRGELLPHEIAQAETVRNEYPRNLLIGGIVVAGSILLIVLI